MHRHVRVFGAEAAAARVIELLPGPARDRSHRSRRATAPFPSRGAGARPRRRAVDGSGDSRRLRSAPRGASPRGDVRARGGGRGGAQPVAGTGNGILDDAASALARGLDYVPTLFVNDKRYTGELDPAADIAALDRVASTAG